VLQLSDPDTYEGGNLLMHIDDPGQKIEKKQGKLVLFPSYVLHEVTPVTKGERYSLVAWLTGKPFK
jgi:PKHD-type hydroxylase